MLNAAPHRGDARATVTLGHVVLGVSSVNGEAALVRDGSWAAAVSGRLDEPLGTERAGARKPEDPGEATAAARALLAAVRADGPAVAARLRGALSAVVTDGTTLWCLRDQFGLVPLHQHDTPEGYLVATEAKQVVAGTNRSPEPDLDGLRDQFYGQLASGQTAIRDVGRVPRATVTTVGLDHGPTSRRYWDPTQLVEAADLQLEDAREEFLTRLDVAVRRCLHGDDAISLSGGLDSPAVALFASAPHREQFGRPLVALSAVFPDEPSVDETPWIELVAEHLHLDLHTHALTAAPLDGMQHWIEVLDAPATTVSVPEMAQSYARVRDLGLGTLLTGELAEYAYGMRHHLLGHLALHGRLRPLATHLWSLRERGRPWHRLAREIVATATPSPLARRYVHDRRTAVFHLPPWVDPAPLGRYGYRDDLARPPRERWRWMQTAALASDSDSLEADEICASTFGLTIRRPFLDVDLWELLLSLRAEVKYPDRRGKAFAREAFRGRLPDELLDRPKKTTFDEHYLAVSDRRRVHEVIFSSRHRVPWIDYAQLEGRLTGGELGVFELKWAHDTAWLHAFLDRW